MSKGWISEKLNARLVLQLAFVVLAAGLLKQYYSAASADDLVWILWPTAQLTQLVTGTRFYFESHAGYMSEDRSFLIAVSCAGVNFLIATFLTLSIGRLWRGGFRPLRWHTFIAFAALSYLVTIVANTVRISSALWLNSSRASFGGFDREEQHRLVGILIYFGFLLLLFVISDRDSKRYEVGRFLLPLSVYYVTALGVPILNGAIWRIEGFWQHAIFVIVTPPVLVATVSIAAQLSRLHRKRKDIAAGSSLLPRHAGTDEVGPSLDVRDAAAIGG